MSIIQAIILGIIQGLTEFLPVSSSGHLELGQTLLGLKDLDQYILFDLIVHLGTLVAILIFFAKDIKLMFTTDHTKLLQICIGILPLFPLLLILRPIKKLFDQPEYLGFFFWTTAALLYAAIKLAPVKKQEQLKATRWRDAFIIGLFQAIAILPGVSRSGSTLSGARLLGWSREQAVNFSFLLAVPTILGGFVIEGSKLLTADAPIGAAAEMSWAHYTAGFITSLAVGYAALRVMMEVVLHDQLMIFVWYCLGIGLFSIISFTL